MDRDEIKKYIRETLSELQIEKQKYLEDMQKAASYMRHRTKERNSKVKEVPIYNTAHLDAINTTVHGVAGYLMSPSIRWFKFVTMGEHFEKSDTLYGANDWLEDVMNMMYSLFSNSRFYATDMTALMDSIVTGTSYEMVSDKMEKGKVIFDAYNPFECYIAENEDGDVDTFFREYTMTARQAYKVFGNDLPDEILDMLKADGDASTECKFVHAIYPRVDYEMGLVPSFKKKWASVHYSHTGDEIVRISGYDDFPLAIHRWKKNDSSPYGTGLVMQYLPEIERLNDLTKQYSIAVQFQASPTTIVPEALRGRFVYRPGYTNYANVNQVGKPDIVPNQLNISYLGQQIQDLELRIRQLLFSDLFNVLMRQDRQRTAYEVQELKGEGLILLSAIMGNMQIEKLSPLVLRTFRTMLRSGALPPPPPELVKASENGMVEVELDGPLAQIMKAYHQATGLQQGMSAIAAVMQIFPDEVAQFDGGEIARQFATAQGLPQSCIREQSDVKKIKEQQAQAQAQAQQQAQALQESQILKNLSGVQPGSVAGLPMAQQGGVA